jgi:hypothetical protein
MLTNIKSFLVNAALLILGVIVVVGLIRWYEKPKVVTQPVITGPNSATAPAAMKFVASIQNPSYWTKQTEFKFMVTDQNGNMVDFQPLDNTSILLVVTNGGEYTVSVNTVCLNNNFWVNPQLVDLGEVDFPVVVSGNAPTPPPNPNPAPTPTNSTYWALAIFDPTQTMTPAQSSIFNSTTIEASLQPIEWGVYNLTDIIPTNKGNLPVSSTKWGTSAKQVGLPALVTIDQNGNVITAIPLPPTEMVIVQEEKSLYNSIRSR